MDRATATMIAERVLAGPDLERWRASAQPELDANEALREHVFGPVRLPKLDKIKPGEVIAKYRAAHPGAPFVDESQVMFDVLVPHLSWDLIPDEAHAQAWAAVERFRALFSDALLSECVVRIHSGWVHEPANEAQAIVASTGLYLRLRARSGAVLISREWSLDPEVSS